MGQHPLLPRRRESPSREDKARDKTRNILNPPSGPVRPVRVRPRPGKSAKNHEKRTILLPKLEFFVDSATRVRADTGRERGGSATVRRWRDPNFGSKPENRPAESYPNRLKATRERKRRSRRTDPEHTMGFVSRAPIRCSFRARARGRDPSLFLCFFSLFSHRDRYRRQLDRWPLRFDCTVIRYPTSSRARMPSILLFLRVRYGSGNFAFSRRRRATTQRFVIDLGRDNQACQKSRSSRRGC